jgi:ribosomal protein S20
MVLMLAMAGCRHKAVIPPLPQITQPVDLVDIPEPHVPEEIEVPVVRLPVVPTASAYSKLRLRKRRPQLAAATPVTPATEPAPQPEVATIGSLSSGGDTSPRAQQEAAGLIAANERRINGLSTQKVEAEKVQLSKVRNFQKQAQDALTSGDTEGAKTLATKAKLLLDDIEKL